MKTTIRLLLALATLSGLTDCDGAYTGSSIGVSGQPKATTVTISPSQPSMQVGSTLQLTAILQDKNGDTLKGRAVVWSSSNDAIATVVPASGNVTGVAVGAALITATVSGDTVKGQTLVGITTAANVLHR